MTDLLPVGWNPFATVSTIEADFKIVVADLEAAKADVLSLQSLVTKLSGGLLTAQTELVFLRQALATAGINVPILPLPVVPIVPTPVAPATK